MTLHPPLRRRLRAWAPEDARIAFLRHATSKIKDAADLAAIQTLGFRGEALAAISSVSKIDLLTRTADAPAGTSLHLEAGKITRQDEAGCPPGTTIIVRDLFYNTPARMKFMKSDAAEGAFIFAAVQKQAPGPSRALHLLYPRWAGAAAHPRRRAAAQRHL